MKHNGFLLPQNTTVEKLISRTEPFRVMEIGDVTAFSLKFFDSFDWRLHAQDLRLLQMASPQGSVLRLKPADGGEPLDTVEFSERPAWPADLPAGPLRERVADLLEMRVLLELAVIRGRMTQLRVFNEDGKTVVWVQYLDMGCTSADVSEPRSLWPRILVRPVKGYERELRRLVGFFANELEFPASGDCMFDEAMAAVGREAGDYTSKLDIPLRPDMPAIDAVRRIQLTLLDTLERNIDGTRADLDSEFLHDLRVATRRTRSALSQIKRVLPDPVVEEYKQRIAWLGQITGPTRDLDVFLLELPRYRASLPSAMAGDLDALKEHLTLAQRTEQKRLRRHLGGERVQTLVKDWRGLLEAPTMPGEPGWFADLPVGRVASRRIWRMFKRVIKAGRAVHIDGPPEEMHELRKDCKKLRYLIEFFRGLYPGEQVKPMVKALKALLDILGDFQDLEVQADKLRRFAADFDASDPAQLRTVMAIGALVADLLRHQQEAHDRFAGCFSAFDSAENRKGYKQLFNTEEDGRA